MPSFDATLMGEMLRTKNQNITEKEKVITIPTGSHFTYTTDYPTHNENITFSDKPHLSLFQNRTQNISENSLIGQDSP